MPMSCLPCRNRLSFAPLSPGTGGPFAPEAAAMYGQGAPYQPPRDGGPYGGPYQQAPGQQLQWAMSGAPQDHHQGELAAIS